MTETPATYSSVLRDREFRALYMGGVVSSIGDQVAKLALASFVFARSENPLLAALALATGYLPWVIGGPILSPLADRRPRRDVMLACDVLRAVLVAAMALPGMPLWALFALLLTASVLTPPFDAARAATFPDILEGDRYVVGSSLANITGQFVQVVGFVVGGAVVAALSPRGALIADAATFVLSGVLIATRVHRRPAASQTSAPTLFADVRIGTQIVFHNSLLRSIVLLAWVGAAFAVVPEGLAVTYARTSGGGDVAIGVLAAASPLGTVVGALVVGRFVAPRRRYRVMLPLALFTFVPLLVTAFSPPVPVAALLWACSGVGLAYQLPANAAFVAALPAFARGRAFGLAQSGLQVVQGLSMAGAGALAIMVSPGIVVAAAAVCGLLGVGAIALAWPHAAMAAAVDAPVAAVAPETPVAPAASVPPVVPLAGAAASPAGSSMASAGSAVASAGSPAAEPAPVVPPSAATVPSAALAAEPTSWAGPYPLRPMPRELLARLVTLTDPDPD